jgi:hypothetical protein
MKLDFSRQIFRKKLKYQVSSKFVQWEPSCSMRTDGRTDMKLIVSFRNFASARKIEDNFVIQYDVLYFHELLSNVTINVVIVVKITIRFMQVIILPDNYRLPLLVGSFIVIT